MNFQKNLFFLAFSVLSSLSFAQNKSIDVLNYSYDIQVSDKDDSIHVVEVIRFVQVSSDTLSLDLVGVQENGKGMRITNHNAAWLIHDGNKLKFSMGKVSSSSVPLDLKIAYSGIPANGLIIGRSE